MHDHNVCISSRLTLSSQDSFPVCIKSRFFSIRVLGVSTIYLKFDVHYQQRRSRAPSRVEFVFSNMVEGFRGADINDYTQ